MLRNIFDFNIIFVQLHNSLPDETKNEIKEAIFEKTLKEYVKQKIWRNLLNK